MQIPGAGDTPPPLFAPSRRDFREPVSSEVIVEESHRRRSAEGTRRSSDPDWEQTPKFSRSRSKERTRMQILLIGGVLLFFAAIAGIFMWIPSGEQADPIRETNPAQEVSERSEIAPTTQNREPSVLSIAEPLAKKFLEADTVDEVLSMVRNPKLTESRLRDYYPSGKIPPVGLVKFNSSGEIATTGDHLSVSVITRDQGEKAISFMETPDGLKVDWESWVGWSELPWEKFLATKPSNGHVFRVILSAVDYYNFGFSDESKWQSYRLESPARNHGLYGYAGQDTELSRRLRLNADQKEILLTLSLKFPPNSNSSSQVEIDKIICEGWVEKAEAP